MPYTENDGVKIYWEEHGRGEPLLLIMGLGYTLDMWHRNLPALSERYRTIVFDNRGLGKSDVPPGPYSTSDMAADAIAVLDDAGVDKAHVLGASLGGLIAEELVLGHPHRVKSLILACTHGGGTEHIVMPSQEVLDMLAARASMTAEEGVRAAIPFVYHAETPRERIDEDLAIRLRTFPSAEGYTAQLAAGLTHDAFDRLKDIKVPTLVIHGDSDALIPYTNAQILAREIPGAKVTIIPKASHVFFTDQPEASNEVVLSFLGEVSRI